MLDSYGALWFFIVLMVSTPGPANLLIMTAGAQYGFARCIPFNIGLISGKLLLNVAMAFGLTSIVQQHPEIAKVFAALSAAYMIWLSLRGWNAHIDTQRPDRELSFRDGVFVHPLSPKAWVMVVLAFSEFMPVTPTVAEQYLLIPLSFVLAQLIFHSSWCLAGVMLRRALGASKVLSRGLALLTIAVVLWALLLA
tara:strand:- start:171 stop:755 length:585 start_codon:yes stop_codon:yes gene_type:complete